jgi:hypothetical protein
MLKENTIKKIDFFLAQLANYMKMHAGDILIDHPTIMERLEARGEIELYLAKMHFDTEKRFEDIVNGTTEQGRQEARRQKWGEWNILLKVDDQASKVSIVVEKMRDDAPNYEWSTLNLYMLDKVTIKNNEK